MRKSLTGEQKENIGDVSNRIMITYQKSLVCKQKKETGLTENYLFPRFY